MNTCQMVKSLMQMNGALAVAVIDYESAMVLASDAKDPDFEMEFWEIVAADATNIIGAIDKVMHLIQVDDDVISVLFTLKDQYHMVYPAIHQENTIIYMVADRSVANLSVSRCTMSSAAKILGLPDGENDSMFLQ